MPQRRGKKRADPKSTARFGKPKPVATRLRIVSGEHRGRKVAYNGDPKTRPMKERTREAVFSLLGGKLDGYWCVDLFGGTGILAFESISRGADSGLIIELSKSAFVTILRNLQELQLEDRLQVKHADTLRWLRKPARQIQDWPDLPWIVFCCPPYAMWQRESERLCEGLDELYRLSPPGSQFVCEAEDGFEPQAFSEPFDWDLRTYPPATIAIARKPLAT